MAHTYFTLEQANRTLPLVRRIVSDIVDEYQHWREHVSQYELVAAQSRGEEAEPAEQVRLRRQIDESARRVNEYVEELSRIGCVLKGFEEGLVDFYSKLGDREIMLCWKHGEPAIEHWHEMDVGYAGRKPLVPEVVGSND